MKNTMSQTFQVSTFANNSNVDSNTTSTDMQSSHIHDAFLHYSNDTTRIQTLKLKRGPSQDDTTVNLRQRKRQRKKRITFELHPSVILEDELGWSCEVLPTLPPTSFEEMRYQQQQRYGVVEHDGDECDLLSVSATSSYANLLRELLEL